MSSSATTMQPPSDLLVRRFSKLVALSDTERKVLRLVEGRARLTYRPGERILVERTEIHAPSIVISGWACESRVLADGRRQIMNVLLPGDLIGASVRVHPASPTGVSALVLLRTVEAREIKSAWRDEPHLSNLAAALDMIAFEDKAFALNHIVRLGRQTAYERLAHWLSELYHRLSERGLASDDTFQLPLTQETIADILGLSVVHVNRTLQQMRGEGIIEFKSGQLSILKPEVLLHAGEFSPPSPWTVELADSPAIMSEPVAATPAPAESRTML